jgi:GntR family transcriptional regulator/MocR family aminotransferase
VNDATNLHGRDGTGDRCRSKIHNHSHGRDRAGLPSTPDLARQLAVSRRVVVDAYAQLAAEGATQPGGSP